MGYIMLAVDQEQGDLRHRQTAPACAAMASAHHEHPAASPATCLPPGPLTPIRLPPTATPYTWTVPGSKSITNRALVLAAIVAAQCGRAQLLSGALVSDDTHHMQRCLTQLGAVITSNADDHWVIAVPQGFHASDGELFVGNSGTTVRFLSALCASIPGHHRLVGDEHMAKRPIADLVVALQQQGVAVTCASGAPPLEIVGDHLPGGHISMPGHRSSQYFSAMMMTALRCAAPLTITIEGELVSRPYVAMTAAMVEDFGGEAQVGANHITVRPGQLAGSTQTYATEPYVIEPDASAASYPLALAAATSHNITVPGLSRQALQGDVAFVDILQQCGASTDATTGLKVDSQAQQGVVVNMEHISDTVMSLAAIAPLLHGTTRITDIANIRIKETDRLAALVNELQRLGQQVSFGDDWLEITPQPLLPASIDCYNDHRIAMSFAVLAAASDTAITITDPACVAKTYPGFWQDLQTYYHHCNGPDTVWNHEGWSCAS